MLASLISKRAKLHEELQNIEKQVIFHLFSGCFLFFGFIVLFLRVCGRVLDFGAWILLALEEKKEKKRKILNFGFQKRILHVILIGVDDLELPR